MSLASLARRSPNLLRKVVALLALAFALSTVVHAAHHHDAEKTNGTYAACSYCAAFGNMLDTTVRVHVARIQQTALAIVLRASTDRACKRILTAAQPRAPPSC